MNESTDGDVLDAVTLELSRFTRDVVAEVHRLRDELTTERRRTDQLELSVQSLTASLRKFDTQAAGIVDHVTKLSAEVDRRLDDVERQAARIATPVAQSGGQPVDTPLSSPVPATPTVVSDGQRTMTDVDDDLFVRPGAGGHDEICFAPLTLTLDPVGVVTAQDASIDDLVARVVGAIAEPPQPGSAFDGAHDLVEPA